MSFQARVLLLVLKWLSQGAVVAWFACWIIAWLVHPWPKWLIPATLAMPGLFFVSALLYYALEARFGDAIEADSSEVARWELDTLRGRLKYFSYQYCYLWPSSVVVAFASLHASNTLHLRSVIAVPLALIIGGAGFWLLMLAYAKGWLNDDESGIG
jgi:hypothetical protein